MKIVIAPDSFKGSISSSRAADKLAVGIAAENPEIIMVKIPVADGGEGTVDAFLTFMNGEKIFEKVENPLGREMSAYYGWVAETKTAIVETAAASGLPLLTAEEYDPYKTSTFGTGQLVKRALDRGAEKIIIGLGGSATVDAGTGFLQALGVKFLDYCGQELKGSGDCLQKVQSIDVTDLDPRLERVEIIVASDVTNPLLGKNGAVSVFGPQKGVQEGDLESFDKSMAHYANLVNSVVGKNEIDTPGSGAAGGFGFSLLSLLKINMQNGFQLIAELSNLEHEIESSDLVITGEGKFDTQSLSGKVPVGIAKIAQKHHIPVIVFAGKFEGNEELLAQYGISAVLPIVDGVMDLQTAMAAGEDLLEKAAGRFMKIFQLGRKLT